MSDGPRAVIRCAIYTRKSSEEGLEQSFNSLDAQREACESFISSQRQEGWRTLPATYDDGGFSGGNIERPALRRLLADVEAKKIDTIVVYKVDRLTRSLADFAKIVEALDARSVSFVSVTQQFNTTSSMGRLTLNVLLSFAQFEREVTGERIRDKIAASKRKGMWMGGTIPLGYDVKERKLVVNSEEAVFVNRLFHLYVELGCVSKLKYRLDQEKIQTKRRTSLVGNRSGGSPYSRGALYKILQNRMYLGEIQHREKSYAGEHAAVVSRELWDEVQARLKSNTQGRRDGIRANASGLLAGLLQDGAGTRFTSSHTLKSGKRYRYYVCPNTAGFPESKPIRLPAHDAEKLVSAAVQSFLQSNRQVIDGLARAEDAPASIQRLIAAATRRSEQGLSESSSYHEFVKQVVRRVVVHENRLEVELGKQELLTALDEPTTSLPSQPPIDEQVHASGEVIRLNIEARLRRSGGEMRLVVPPELPGQTRSPVSSLLKAVTRGRQWYDWILSGEASSQRSIAHKLGLNERYVGRILECAFLAPDIVEAILDGRQPLELTFQKLTCRLPSSWSEQRKSLGFPPVRGGRPQSN
jgi:DNA invertase Pin-like site-specific DNA recombinase